ncbi:LTA synthase family protein [Aminobacter sp. HY435]|uniref:LTA synthase family protein n=1 Tax=Aminobacter sp. HY435 TaxID=2970917 RepID=UPI0022B94546|nr:LTA synthase family protein [Aminobacter sp. HY435]
MVTLAVSAILVFAIEFIARGSFVDTLNFFQQPFKPSWTTVALFALLLIGLDALLGRPYNGLLVVAPIALGLAFVGHQKSMYLGDPLYPTDFLYARQIVELMPLLVRERPLAGIGIAAGLIVGVSLLVFAWRHWRRRVPVMTFWARISRLAIALPALAFFVSIMDYATFSWTRDRLQIIPMMWDQKENYASNGFAIAFALNVPMAKVKAPHGYSEKAIDAIAKPEKAAAVLPEEKPDVIIVMSESFWDPKRLPGVNITPDPIPSVRAAQSGHVFSPEFGGMTANVEFEALTGFSNAFLPAGSIPYQQYVRAPVPSLATFFRSEGYETKAIHPFGGWFWNRAPVYKAFGFDRFMSEENMPALEKRGPLASDAALTEEIIREADATDHPFFFFAVSLQSHGPYEPNRYTDTTHKVEAPGISQWARDSTLTYAEGASDADRSLQRLMDWASKRKRPTVIAFFGDHLPPLGPVYVETGFMKEPVAKRKAPIDEMLAQHETPLVVWSNRTGAARDIGAISPAFLPLHVLETAGISHPYYTGFLGDVRDRFRVVDRNMLMPTTGESVFDWSRQKEIDPSIRDFRWLQYDMMFGKRRGAKQFFPETIEKVVANRSRSPLYLQPGVLG